MTRRINLTLTFWFALATPLLLSWAVLFMEGQKGIYIPAAILFPWAVGGAIAADVENNYLFLGLAIMQFPLYGLFFDWVRSERLPKASWVAIPLLHAVAVLIVLSTNPGSLLGIGS